MYYNEGPRRATGSDLPASDDLLHYLSYDSLRELIHSVDRLLDKFADELNGAGLQSSQVEQPTGDEDVESDGHNGSDPCGDL
jgi:hypothetical protein